MVYLVYFEFNNVMTNERLQEYTMSYHAGLSVSHMVQNGKIQHYWYLPTGGLKLQQIEFGIHSIVLKLNTALELLFSNG